MNVPLTPEDRAAMLARALAICPDLSDADVVVIHLHHLGITLSAVSDILPGAIDEARAESRKRMSVECTK